MSEETRWTNLSAQEYQVVGKSQTRIETRFSENEYSCVVKYAELEHRKVNLEIRDFQQSSGALTDTLGADLSHAINNVTFQLDAGDEPQAILNTAEIEAAWAAGKPQLVKKYADIPDFETLLDSYGKNLKDGPKLLAAIKDKGLYGLFFPRLKHLLAEKLPVQFTRTKSIKEFMPSIDLLISERLISKEYGPKIIVEITGELDQDNFDYGSFLELNRRMFGKQVEAADISFHSVETYTVNRFNLLYTSGAQHHHFETKGVFFKDDKQEFRVKD